jgi:hypothetical protein
VKTIVSQISNNSIFLMQNQCFYLQWNDFKEAVRSVHWPTENDVFFFKSWWCRTCNNASLQRWIAAVTSHFVGLSLCIAQITADSYFWMNEYLANLHECDEWMNKQVVHICIRMSIICHNSTKYGCFNSKSLLQFSQWQTSLLWSIV